MNPSTSWKVNFAVVPTRALTSSGAKPGTWIRMRSLPFAPPCAWMVASVVLAMSQTAKTMALQLLDDLNEPLVANALRDEHRLQLVRIVGEHLDRRRHG